MSDKSSNRPTTLAGASGRGTDWRHHLPHDDGHWWTQASLHLARFLADATPRHAERISQRFIPLPADLRPFRSASVRTHREAVHGSTPVEGLRALADPIRWAIVKELRGGTRCACVLADVAGVSAPLLSHHLKVLREAELVSVSKRGRWVDYTLDDEAIDRLAALVAGPVRCRT